MLRGLAPREPLVLFSIGKLHALAGRTNTALIFLNHALDLDNRSSNVIKAAIDQLHNSNEISFEL